MNTTVIIDTNPVTGTITTTTIIHHDNFHYGWLLLALLALALIGSGLRAMFWTKDSN